MPATSPPSRRSHLDETWSIHRELHKATSAGTRRLAVPEKTVHLPMLTNVGNNKPTEALAENTVDFGGTGRRKASGSHLVSEPAEQTCVEML